MHCPKKYWLFPNLLNRVQLGIGRELRPLSQLLIQRYLNELSKLRQVSGTNRESVVREAFKDLLKGWARQHDLIFVPEYQLEIKTKDRRYVDGALLHTLRVPFGYRTR